ncbi:hypothetical protein BDN70DRAFT_878222 [Pholiota conissans]|uniref:Uncharacterized protein n=1 Tax=Pholiota conissans TaxID=109636 RepID=A0A9P6D119_9AGAR|nr:hypothetical protein BDN70DRAFT_878222 [Pholiota conissans]
MKLDSVLVLSAVALSASARPFNLARRDVDPSLIPEFGVQPGVNPTGTGDCDGIPNAQGVPIKIPCICPPDRATFIADLNANVAAGHAVNNTGVQVTFPTDNSKASQLARITAATITLQNLRGPGVGCPQAATTFGAQAAAIQAGTAASAPAPVSSATPASAPAAPAAPAAGGVDPALVPEFGVQAGVNPTGTGDCDGIPNAQGVPIKIPCICPPDRATFIADLSANVAAGHAVNNTGVNLSFPTDNSKASQLARLNAATITLQNLRGPGVGCPQAATTFGAQAQAIQNS